jgi:hypothetical protein
LKSIKKNLTGCGKKDAGIEAIFSPEYAIFFTVKRLPGSLLFADPAPA